MTEQSQSPLTSSAERLRQELDRWLEAAWHQGERALGAIGMRSSKWTPTVDVIETGDAVQVYVDLPGIKPYEVDVSLTGNMLTIQGERTEPEVPENTTVHVRERSRGRFCRSIPLPAPVDMEDISAEAKDGTLCIKLTKSERAKAKQIPVNAGN